MKDHSCGHRLIYSAKQSVRIEGGKIPNYKQAKGFMAIKPTM